MDCDTAAYKQARYDEIANEMKSMLVKVGWKKGNQGIEEEWRNRGVEMPVDYDQEETDWNQEAVIDEDQLK
jgi:hypothetical protein